MRDILFGVFPVAALLATIHFAVGSVNRDKRLIEALCTFVASFFLVLGVRTDPFGAVLASLAVTFFWMQWRKPG